MRRFRGSAVILLALVVALSSVTTTVARAAHHGLQSIVICSGHGARTITLDANGNRVTPVHCPDCVAAATTALLPEVIPAPAPTLRLVARSLPAREAAPDARDVPARRPPLSEPSAMIFIQTGYDRCTRP